MKLSKVVHLDPDLRCRDSIRFEENLRRRVIGQEEAVQKVTEAIGVYMAGLQPPNRPIANVLFLGPTGVGKTRLAESVADILLGTEKACVKINCGEFQQPHDIAKLTGSPPGYVGHRDSVPFITQEKLNKYHTDDNKISIVLFDELEKANPSFRDLLLGIMDKGTLRISNGSEVDFTNTIIFMTSNVGAREMQDMVRPMGFNPSKADPRIDTKLKDTANNAMRKQFSPEFINRIDKSVVFKSLKESQLKSILHIELEYIQKRILNSTNTQKFVITLDDLAEKYLLEIGISPEYGARELKRVLEKKVVSPISSLVLSSQIKLGDVVKITVVNDELFFDKIPCEIADKLPEYLEVEA